MQSGSPWCCLQSRLRQLREADRQMERGTGVRKQRMAWLIVQTSAARASGGCADLEKRMYWMLYLFEWWCGEEIDGNMGEAWNHLANKRTKGGRPAGVYT